MKFINWINNKVTIDFTSQDKALIHSAINDYRELGKHKLFIDDLCNKIDNNYRLTERNIDDLILVLDYHISTLIDRVENSLLLKDISKKILDNAIMIRCICIEIQYKYFND